MRESEKRIREYQEMLPHLKEKVSTIAFLFVISIVMMTAATFAWITVSSNPEVEGITTTVSANGNLEIALSDEDGLEPNESQVGDSGKDILKKNITWGNLVNLSHEGYGIQNIILRPAALQEDSLLDNPLYSVAYGTDGRITKTRTDFAYTNYNSETGKFRVNKDENDDVKVLYGVRAISSVTYTFEAGSLVFVEMQDEAEGSWFRAREDYKKLVDKNTAHMKTLANIIGKFLTEKISDAVQNYSEDIETIYDLMVDLNEQVMVPTGNAYLSLANLQILINNSANYEALHYNNLNELIKDSNPASRGVDLDALVGFSGTNGFKSDYQKFQTYLDDMQALRDEVAVSGRTVVYSEISAAVNFLVVINDVEVDGTRVGDINTGNLSDVISIFTGVMQGKILDVVITKGAIKNLEQRIGKLMYIEKMSVPVKGVPIFGNMNLIGNVSTSADAGTIDLELAMSELEDKDDINFQGTDPVSEDTYGMAIDFWVRTNADNTYLILEEDVNKTIVQKQDSDGSLYYTDENGISYVENGGKYYLEGKRDTALTDEELAQITLSPVNEVKVTGYEGENRVWANEGLSADSTTQGMGSCYVFYADTPEDQSKSLNLLESMKIAFVDEEGALLSTAEMDTSQYYAENGRVTVPLKLSSDSISVGKDANGEEIKGITQLKKGEAIRLTALVYLEGSLLTNEEVTAVSDIQGQLNIQLGSSMELYPIDSEIMYDEIKLSATSDVSTFEEYTHGATEEAVITLNIEGNINPEKIEGVFSRRINSTQGSRQPEFAFAKVSDGKWQGTMKFTAPGTYVLSTVWIDGIEYELEKDITIEWPGYSVENVTWEYSSYKTVMTDAANFDVDFGLTVKGIQPESVDGVFTNEYGQQITVSMKYDVLNWKGTASFTSSGTYVLQYAIIDGEYYEIPADAQKTLDLTLGMRIRAYVSKTEFIYSYETPTDNVVTISALVYDDRGNAIGPDEIGSEVDIYYRSATSGISQNGFNTKLEWDESQNRYSGEVAPAKPGVYSFNYVELEDGNVIGTGEAPSIYAMSPVPPSYYTHEARDYVVNTGAAITTTVTLENAGGYDASVVTAVFTNGSETMYSTATAASGSNNITYTFQLPEGDGVWQLLRLQMVGVYVDGIPSTEAEPYVVDLEDKKIQTEVETINLGIGQTTVNATYNCEFMVENALSAQNFQVTLTNNNKTQLKTMPEYITVKYEFNVGKWTDYVDGGATVMNLLNDSDELEFVLYPNSNHTVYQVKDAQVYSFLYAGEYKCKEVSFTMNGITYSTLTDQAGVENVTMIGNMPEYKVNWNNPEAKFVGTSNEYVADLTYSSRDVTSGCNTVTQYTAPIVTIQLSSVGNMETGTCIIEDTENGNDAEFKFIANDLNDEQPIGVDSQEQCYEFSGSATTVELSKGDVGYTFTLDTALKATCTAP